jgi:type II secretion system protein N
MMTSKKNVLLYSIYIVFVTAFFIYFLFPSAKIKEYITLNLNNTHPDINISLDQVKPAFPLGLRLQQVDLYHQNDFLLNAEHIRIAPDFLSLFRSKPIFVFKGRTYDGVLEGKGEFTEHISAGNVVIDAKLSNVQINKVDTIQRLIGLKISGILNGDLTYHGGGKQRGNLRAKLDISDCTIELLNPFFNLDSIVFNNIDTDFTVKNRKLQFKHCVFTGNQVNGSIAGSVTLTSPIGQSTIKLIGTVKPHQLFLTKLGEDFPVDQLPKKIFSKTGFPVKFFGTLDKPDFSF